jgi:hypothetical protein
MATVWIANKSGHDFGAAEQFGRIHYLTFGSLSVLSVNSIYRKVNDVLANSSPEDYLILTGLPVIGAIACACFVEKHGRLNLLIYKGGQYMERNLVFEKHQRS